MRALCVCIGKVIGTGVYVYIGVGLYLCACAPIAGGCWGLGEWPGPGRSGSSPWARDAAESPVSARPENPRASS